MSRPWAAAVGYQNLKHLTHIRIKGVVFDLNLQQDMKNKVLYLEEESTWTEGHDGRTYEWTARRPLRYGFQQLLYDLMDRKVEPGLSPRALEKIVGYVQGDYYWYGVSKKLSGR